MELGKHIGKNTNRILNSPAISAATANTLNILRKPTFDNNFETSSDPTGWQVSLNKRPDRTRFMPFHVSLDDREPGTINEQYLRIEKGKWKRFTGEGKGIELESIAGTGITEITATDDMRKRWPAHDTYLQTTIDTDTSRYIYCVLINSCEEEGDKQDGFEPDELEVRIEEDDPSDEGGLVEEDKTQNTYKILAYVRNDGGTVTIWQKWEGHIKDSLAHPDKYFDNYFETVSNVDADTYLIGLDYNDENLIQDCNVKSLLLDEHKIISYANDCALVYYEIVNGDEDGKQVEKRYSRLDANSDNYTDAGWSVQIKKDDTKQEGTQNITQLYNFYEPLMGASNDISAVTEPLSLTTGNSKHLIVARKETTGAKPPRLHYLDLSNVTCGTTMCDFYFKSGIITSEVPGADSKIIPLDTSRYNDSSFAVNSAGEITFNAASLGDYGYYVCNGRVSIKTQETDSDWNGTVELYFQADAPSSGEIYGPRSSEQTIFNFQVSNVESYTTNINLDVVTLNTQHILRYNYPNTVAKNDLDLPVGSTLSLVVYNHTSYPIDITYGEVTIHKIRGGWQQDLGT